jgi:hypothetical protein
MIPVFSPALFMPKTVATVYQGVGDIVAATNWVYWGGLRAFTLAGIGGNAIQLRRDSDQATQIFVTVAGGGLDIASITAFKGAANLFVSTLYDQTGHSNNFIQATAANQPSFSLTGGPSGGPQMGFVSSGQLNLTNSSVVAGALVQPYSFTAVVERTANFTVNQAIVSDNVGTQMSFNTTNTVMLNSGTALFVAAADSTWHGLVGTFNSATSNMQVDAASNSGTAGTNGTSNALSLGHFGGGGAGVDGNAVEFGISASTLGISTVNAISINSQSKSYYGY